MPAIRRVSLEFHGPPGMAADHAREPEAPRSSPARSFWLRSVNGEVPGVGAACGLDGFMRHEDQKKRLTLP